MRKLMICLMILSFIMIVVDIIYLNYSGYLYEQQFGCYWNLADKASTIPQKAKYIDRFVDVLESGGFSGKHNALWLKTLDNSYDYNMEALKSLQKRLHEIEKMNVSSFEYNTAIQQITAQEQGEASNMLGVFSGIWYKENFVFLWNWIGILQLTSFLILFIVSAIHTLVTLPD